MKFSAILFFVASFAALAVAAPAPEQVDAEVAEPNPTKVIYLREPNPTKVIYLREANPTKVVYL
ncbi:hypothetical protein HDU76_005764 [Blyttiomyces sp. JEL0837]|nr:hypothetical protein HDU76_005764 [Blyttiomyces sp. JEL0837]